MEFEVVNGLVIAQRRGRIDNTIIFNAIDGFLNLEINLKNLSDFRENVLYFCRDFDISAYDASYLALANATNIPFITADERLFKKVKESLDWVTWIGDIR